LSLFRIVEPYSGKIFIDGVDVTEIGLDILRQKLCVIPQDPVLFKGTVRYNLDPFEENTESELQETLSILFPNEDPKQLLDKEVQDGGLNFSVGQKQLICIARAIIRKSKIMFLDEATASVDYKTDELIQNTIRERFQGRTVLTIAHRINTILDYDRVLVMDNGRVAEFDTPDNLLKQQGIFYELVSAYKS
jgi:ABC-type multidrug transport system fused ATPase/permease subunit